jgi:hypothetical protein
MDELSCTTSVIEYSAVKFHLMLKGEIFLEVSCKQNFIRVGKKIEIFVFVGQICDFESEKRKTMSQM